MSLSYRVLQFVDRAFKDPASASNPALLKQLENAARNAFEGIVALTAPASPMTWETVAVVRGATQTSPRIPFRFPRPVEIVGFFPTLIILTTGGAISPSLDSLAVSIDTDNQNYMTSGDGVSTPAGGTAGPYVTLSSMAVQVPRVVGYKLRNPTPDIGFTYRWKLDVSGGAVFKDALVSMAMFARYLG